ncbi:MAG: dienelactone hydrolase family protein [Saprospiraceae bacterium]
MFCRFTFFIFIGFLLFTGCTASSNQFDPFVYGKVRKTIYSEGEEREYFLHIPSSYIGSKALPVVIVLHNSGSSGEQFYNESGWSKLCEKESIFGVFPTAKTYCTDINGISQNRSFWHVSPVADPPFCNGNLLRNDVLMMQNLIERLTIDFNIDKKAIYIVGFGNGGQLAAKAGLEMGDKLAAKVEFAGSFSNDGTWNSTRNVPTFFQVGNNDLSFFNTQNQPDLALFSQAIQDKNNPLNKVVIAYGKAYGLQIEFVLSGDTNTLVKATFKDAINNPVLEMSLLKNVGHTYPAANVNINLAEQHWNWLKHFRLN